MLQSETELQLESESEVWTTPFVGTSNQELLGQVRKQVFSTRHIVQDFLCFPLVKLKPYVRVFRVV